MFRCLLSLLKQRRRQKTCPLNRLPTELLLEIVSCLAPSISDLASLVVTNRRFHHLVTPLLLTAALGSHDRFGRSIIRRAVGWGNVGLLERLLLHGDGAGVDERVPNTRTTALHAAIMLQRREVVRVLLRHGAGVDVGDRKGWSALHWAVLSGDCGLVEEVLSHRATQGADDEKLGMTPLHMAVVRGDTAMARLLMRWGASVAAEDGYQMTAVDYAMALVEGGRAGNGDESMKDLVRLMVAAVTSDHEARVVGGKASYDWVILKKRMMLLRWSSVLCMEKWLARQK